MLATSALAACATTEEGQPQVAVAPVPDAAKPESVSVFGIFRNGRMSAEAWEDFGKALSMPFDEGICKAAYDVVFADANPKLASAIDDYTKENGVSDELLAKFAPLAKGDTILLIAINGQLPKPAAASAEKPSKPAQNPSASGQGKPALTRRTPSVARSPIRAVTTPTNARAIADRHTSSARRTPSALPATAARHSLATARQPAVGLA